MGLWDSVKDFAGSGLPGVVGSIGASMIGAASSARQMRQQDKWRKTAHQDEVADLRAAGLNPVLSAGGSGAATPMGASYNPENPAGKLATDIIAQQNLKRQKMLDKAEINKKGEEARTLKTQQTLNTSQQALNHQSIAESLTRQNVSSAQQYHYIKQSEYLDKQIQGYMYENYLRYMQAQQAISHIDLNKQQKFNMRKELSLIRNKILEGELDLREKRVHAGIYGTPGIGHAAQGIRGLLSPAITGAVGLGAGLGLKALSGAAKVSPYKKMNPNW